MKLSSNYKTLTALLAILLLLAAGWGVHNFRSGTIPHESAPPSVAKVVTVEPITPVVAKAVAPVAILPPAPTPAMPLVVLRELKLNLLDSPFPKPNRDSTGNEKPINKWLEIRSEYRVSKDWVDSAQFKYYIAMEGGDPEQDAQRQINILTGDVTYEDIPKGTHLSAMYLTPTKFLRFGKVTGYRVEVYADGLPVAMKEEGDARLEATADWHKQPGKRVLLNRMQTPFSPIDPGHFNGIKVEAGR